MSGSQNRCGEHQVTWYATSCNHLDNIILITSSWHLVIWHPHQCCLQGLQLSYNVHFYNFNRLTLAVSKTTACSIVHAWIIVTGWFNNVSEEQVAANLEQSRQSRCARRLSYTLADVNRSLHLTAKPISRRREHKLAVITYQASTPEFRVSERCRVIAQTWWKAFHKTCQQATNLPTTSTVRQCYYGFSTCCAIIWITDIRTENNKLSEQLHIYIHRYITSHTSHPALNLGWNTCTSQIKWRGELSDYNYIYIHRYITPSA